MTMKFGLRMNLCMMLLDLLLLLASKGSEVLYFQAFFKLTSLSGLYSACLMLLPTPASL